MASALSSFKQDHKVVAGLVMVGAGLLGVAGSVTGTLAAMLAGLFAPNALYVVPGTSNSGGGSGSSPNPNSAHSKAIAHQP